MFKCRGQCQLLHAMAILKIDNIVLSWIFTTIAKPLQSRIVDAKPQTAKEAWDLLAHIFQDNKRTHSIALKAELRSLKLGDLSVDAYFQKIKSIVSVLKGLGSPLSDDDVVNLALEGLPPRYDNVYGIIVHREPFSDLKAVRSMLTTEETRLRSRAQDIFVDSTSSSPLVLMASNGTNTRRPPSSTEKVHKPGFNFNKGACRYGEYCKFLHNRVHGSSSRGTKTSTEIPNDDMQTLKKLMAKLGFDASVLNSGTSTVQTSNSGIGTVPMVFHYSHPNNSQLIPSTTPSAQACYYPSAQSVSPLLSQQQALPMAQLVYYTQAHPAQQTVQPAQFFIHPGTTGQPSPMGHPSPTGQPTGQIGHGSISGQHVFMGGFGSLPRQETIIPSAFNAVTLQDPTSGNWNMDTGASSHLNDSVSSLSDIFNMCIYPSISVGDGHSIPVTNSGHSILPTFHRPLHLHNPFITPNIVKNLIYVRQFVRDNSCTIEFDAFGFSVKDFLTRRVLLRCDSTGDLYPVRNEVLRRVLSSNSISCNKEKLPVLCHACQLGKHVKLPFVSSNTLVQSSFDIVHSDLWTSPILSLSDF
ncbi:ribonuclease H-like domain-containing protein, partial [Tanacetum coccineum]